MKQKHKDFLVILSAVLAVAVLICGSVAIFQTAPCGLWKYGRAGDMPARCLHK